MIRGGSWNKNGENCTAANRNRNAPDNANNNVGFRVLAAPLRLRRQTQRNRPSAGGGIVRRASEVLDFALAGASD
jgi:hypothetical protein